MPSLPYPKNTIWYIEASDLNGSNKTTGSAIAIQLQKIGDSESARTYLITCAHVLRGKSKDDSDGFGSLLPKILVWPPNHGYDPKKGKEVTIDENIKTLTLSEVSRENREIVADDWAILKFKNDTESIYIDSVKVWIDHYSNEQKYQIIGYPGGSNKFFRDIVEPTKSEAFQCCEESNGVLISQGDQTRPGTSGGGVFEVNENSFAGIHRSRTDLTLQVHAVSAKKIREILLLKKYEPSDCGVQNPPPSGLPPPSPSSANGVVNPVIWLKLVSQIATTQPRDPSHNRAEFLEKIDQLLQGDLDMPTATGFSDVTDINEYRKARPDKMLKDNADDLTQKYFYIKCQSETFANCRAGDFTIRRSLEILQEIMEIISSAETLFKQKGGCQNKINISKKCFESAFEAAESLEEIMKEINNRGTQGYNYSDTQKFLRRLGFNIDQCSALLSGVES